MMTLDQPNGLVVLILIFVIGALGLAVLGPMLASVDPVISHADLRHGTEADTARQCKGRGGHLFFNPTTNRYAIACDIEGMWGIVVTDAAGREVTAFLKNKMKRFEQVLNYMKNQGYELIQ